MNRTRNTMASGHVASLRTRATCSMCIQHLRTTSQSAHALNKTTPSLYSRSRRNCMTVSVSRTDNNSSSNAGRVESDYGSVSGSATKSAALDLGPSIAFGLDRRQESALRRALQNGRRKFNMRQLVRQTGLDRKDIVQWYGGSIQFLRLLQ